MVKRKKKAEDAKEPQVPAASEATQEYEIGQWSGKPHYKCFLCKFDTLNEDAILGHIQAMHRPHFAPKRAPSVLVADKRGNDVTNQAASEDDGNLNHMFEVELEEVESTIDEQGNEHKTYTIKE